MTRDQLRRALLSAERPSAELLRRAFIAVHGEAEDGLVEMDRMLAAGAWHDAAMLIVPVGWRLCLSWQTPDRPWAAVGIGRGVPIRQWMGHAKAHVMAHSIALVAMLAAETAESEAG